MHQGLPAEVSVGSVNISSSELKFGASVKSTTLAWASEKSPSGSWVSSYVPSTSGVISIWDAIFEN